MTKPLYISPNKIVSYCYLPHFYHLTIIQDGWGKVEAIQVIKLEYEE